MSSIERRREKAEEWAAEQARINAEQRRKDALSFYERIQESDASEEVKAILIALAERCVENIYEPRE